MSNIDDKDREITDKELISGRIYTRLPISEGLEETSQYLQEYVQAYLDRNNNPAEIYKPFESITLENTTNTIIRPLFALRKSDSENQVDWIIDYARNADDILAFCIKPVVFKDAGINEYWILDLENRQVIIFQLQRTGFIQTVIVNPRRIKSGIYNSLLLNYSDIFKQDW